jgi:hypothetical protein
MFAGILSRVLNSQFCGVHLRRQICRPKPQNTPKLYNYRNKDDNHTKKCNLTCTGKWEFI